MISMAGERNDYLDRCWFREVNESQRKSTKVDSILLPLWQEVATKIGNLGVFVAKKMATKPPVLIGVNGEPVS